MRVLVCGGRDYADIFHVFETLDHLDRTRGPITCVIHGAAPGADHLGMQWVLERAEEGSPVKHAPFVAMWGDLSHPDAVIKVNKAGKRYDANAGLRRNARMIAEGRPDLVLAFPGGAGTADMVRLAKKAGLDVIEVKAWKKERA